jgi:hypothetical protein
MLVGGDDTHRHNDDGNMGLQILLLVLLVSLLAIVEGWLSPSYILTTRLTRRKIIPPFLQQQSSSHNDAVPQVWILDETSLDHDDAWKSHSVNDWKSHSINDHNAAIATFQWARDCPWAKASLLSEDNAFQLFLVDSTNICEDTAIHVAEHVASQFTQFITRHPALETTAIFFVVFASFSNNSNNNDDKTWCDSFSDFSEWFVELKDEIWDDDAVKLATYHPDSQFEERTPYPTITLVSTRIMA